MKHNIEIIFPNGYSDFEYRNLVINELRKKFSGGEASVLIDRLENDTTFFTGYMEGKMLLIMRDGKTNEIIAHVLLMIVLRDERYQFPQFIPGAGMAVVLQANVFSDKLNEIHPFEALLKLLNAAEERLKVLSKKYEDEGKGSIDSIMIELSPQDWRANMVEHAQFMQYEVKFLLPYIQQHEKYDEENHPATVKNIDEDNLQLMYWNLDDKVAKQLADPGITQDMKYINFKADEYEVIVEVSGTESPYIYIPQCKMYVPAIEIKRMALRHYFPEQDEVSDVSSDLPRTIAAIEQVGEYACHRYSWPELAIIYRGTELEVDLIGPSYVHSIMYIRSLNHYAVHR